MANYQFPFSGSVKGISGTRYRFNKDQIVVENSSGDLEAYKEFVVKESAKKEVKVAGKKAETASKKDDSEKR